MKYAIWLAQIVVSFAASRLVLWLVNPDDPEGTNLLITTILAAVIFIPLFSMYLFATKKHKAKN
jgi:hypothetical protein